jgi:hypothetical protein
MDDDLAYLRFAYDGAYSVQHPQPDMWIAERLDTRETLKAETADGLLGLIRADYFARPIPRQRQES